MKNTKRNGCDEHEKRAHKQDCFYLCLQANERKPKPVPCQCVDLVTGLFHRAIAQSGSALNPWAFDDPQVARRKAFRFARTLGYTTTDSNELLEFLMTVPAQRLVEAMIPSATEEVRTVWKA